MATTNSIRFCMIYSYLEKEVNGVTNDRNTKIGEIASMVCQMNEEQLKNVHEYTEDELKEPNHEAVALDAVIQISKKYGKKKTDANQEGE